jgi:DNA invertase Pin-like site-specific DNA recombinase
MEANTIPEEATLWARISNDAAGDAHGVDNQETELQEFNDKRLGWVIKHVVKENDQSATKRTRQAEDRRGWTVWRTNRPKMDKILRMIRNGDTDGVLVRDLDRAVRDMRDLEDLIDACESRPIFVPVYSMYGGLQLRDRTDATIARLLATLAIDEAARTARRIKDRKRIIATEGKYRGGPRPYGFEPDGITIRPLEAAAIVFASDMLLEGASLGAVCRELDSRGFPFGVKPDSRTAGREIPKSLPWRGTTLRAILLRARNAGLIEQHGIIVGKAVWSAIISEDKWRTICDILRDPSRRTTPGPQAKHLGAGIYWCGQCTEAGIDSHVKSMWGSDPDAKAYLCRRKLHLQLKMKYVDEFVIDAIIGRLAKPDAVSLLREKDGRSDAESARLSRAIAAVRQKQVEVRESYKNGRLNITEYETVSADLRRQREELEAVSVAHSDTDPLRGIPIPLDRVSWNALPIGRQREIVKDLCNVTLYRPGMPLNQHNPFDPDSVWIDWLR